MKFESQIAQIKSFIESKEKNLIICNVNEDVTIFYISLINYFAKQKNINVNDKGDGDYKSIDQSSDLFLSQNEIKIFSAKNLKKLENLFHNKTDKKIIFTDYKNFKGYKNKAESINAFQYEQDINYYISKVLEIKSEILISFCKQNPALTFSEISKYLINSNYIGDTLITDQKNHLISLRRYIFSIKNKRSEVKSLYDSIKSEAFYKRFNFLIY